MRPGRLLLTIYQGATLRRTFVWKAPDEDGTLTPVDLTDWTAVAQVRINGSVVLTIDSGHGMTVGTDDGSVTLLVAADAVNALPSGSGAWSLELQAPDGGDRVVLLSGPAQVVERVQA